MRVFCPAVLNFKLFFSFVLNRFSKKKKTPITNDDCWFSNYLFGYNEKKNNYPSNSTSLSVLRSESFFDLSYTLQTSRIRQRPVCVCNEFCQEFFKLHKCISIVLFRRTRAWINSNSRTSVRHVSIIAR